MSSVVKLTSGGMISLPAKLRKKYHLCPGDSIAIVESPDGLLLIPVLALVKLVDPNEASVSAEICRELIEEHRNEQGRESSH